MSDETTPVGLWERTKAWADKNRTISGALVGGAAGIIVPGVGTVIGAIVGASMSVSATRPVRHNVPSQLSIVARPHEDGLMRSWRADSCAFVWHDPGITPCCKTIL